MMIKAVILDLDDTLYAYKPLDREAGMRVRKYVCGALGITEKQYEEAYLFGRNETKRCLGDVGASHNRLLYFQKTLEYLGVNPMPVSLRMYETYWGTFLENMTLFEGAGEFLALMRERGIKVMICTDLTAHIQHRKIEALGIAQDICCLVTSEEAGKEKPSPEVFMLCLEKLGLCAEEVLCMGDSLEKDVKGAQAVGMQAVLFHPDEPSRAQFAAVGDNLAEKGTKS